MSDTKAIKELSIGDVQEWMEKFEKLTSYGSKIVHIRYLLERNRDYSVTSHNQELIQQIKELKTKDILDSYWGNSTTQNLWAEGYIKALDDILSLLNSPEIPDSSSEIPNTSEKLDLIRIIRTNFERTGYDTYIVNASKLEDLLLEDPDMHTKVKSVQNDVNLPKPTQDHSTKEKPWRPDDKPFNKEQFENDAAEVRKTFDKTKDCEHDFKHLKRHGRADWRCRVCGENLMLELVLLQEAEIDLTEE